jgi:hypothetical protein
MSEKAKIEVDITITIESIVVAMLLDSDAENEEDEDDYLDQIETLGASYDIISSARYLQRGKIGSAGKLGVEAIDRLTEMPERAFLALFRMHRQTFWDLCELLEDKGSPLPTLNYASN